MAGERLVIPQGFEAERDVVEPARAIGHVDFGNDAGIAEKAHLEPVVVGHRVDVDRLAVQCRAIGCAVECRGGIGCSTCDCNGQHRGDRQAHLARRVPHRIRLLLLRPNTRESGIVCSFWAPNAPRSIRIGIRRRLGPLLPIEQRGPGRKLARARGQLQEWPMSLGKHFPRAGSRLAIGAAMLTAVGLTAAPQAAHALSPAAGVGIGLGAFAAGTALGAAANPYYNPYYYPYGSYYPGFYYTPAPAYYPASPYYTPRSCWNPYYRHYYAC